MELNKTYSKIERNNVLCYAGFPLGDRANKEKKQLACLATNTDDIATQSHSLFACSREKNRQVENRFYCAFLAFQNSRWHI
jgi:hypothetical protein